MPDAREALYRELSVRLRLILQYRLWGWSKQDREDIVQESLCTLERKLDQVNSNPHLFACKILHNKIGDALRRRKVANVSLQTDPVDDLGSPVILPDKDSDGLLAEIDARYRIELVQNAIKDLSSFCREFFLGILEGRKVQELWRHFRRLEPDLQRSTFDKRIFDCRKRLKQLVKDQT